MITLRNLVYQDRSIGSITTDECKLISIVLDFVATLMNSWFFRFFVPKEIKEQALKVRMLSAVLGRTPNERVPMKEQIRIAIELGIGKKTSNVVQIPKAPRTLQEQIKADMEKDNVQPSGNSG